MKKSLIAALCLMPVPVLADCVDDAQLLFKCTFNDGEKQVTTCLSGDVVSYAFGPVGSMPELGLLRMVQDVDMRPWNGFGRYINESFTLENSGYSYTLRYAIDKFAEEGDGLEGELWVEKGEESLATLFCDPGSLKFSGYSLPLYEAKEAAGQTYDREAEIWRNSSD